MATTSATPSLSVHQRALRSNVVKKAIMAVTGLVLITFLLFHMFGNLKMFVDAEAYNHYASWLHDDILYPILPHGWFIWIFRVVLLACLVGHVYCAASLWRAARHARSSKYVHAAHRPEQTYAARTMRVGGVILLLLVIFHLLMFTTRSVQIGFDSASTPYEMMIGAFSLENWWVVLIYAIFVGVVCMHVRHGFWSAFTTLGANVGPNARIALNCLAYFVAVLLFVGFMLPPVAIMFGMVN
ncbi:MAG: succinate dehydrogenase cytochrome b subunit [Propionibacteriaceae bacterium]|nr:succinate dehydrogenase cytochrome b subunit [Propionibacteriaceae bacterium]